MNRRAEQSAPSAAPEYKIRPAHLADADRLVELLRALQDHVEASNPTIWQMTVEARGNLRGQIASRLRAETVCALVAEHQQDGIVGMIFGRIVTNNRYEPARSGFVDQVYVDPDHRGRGVGRCLVGELCHFFAGEGVEDLSLRYVVGNAPAAAFWTALGFEPRIVTAGASRREVEQAILPSG
jgi:ribosomal protein S18 acetylase RimI-like enzyme